MTLEMGLQQRLGRARCNAASFHHLVDIGVDGGSWAQQADAQQSLIGMAISLKQTYAMRRFGDAVDDVLVRVVEDQGGVILGRGCIPDYGVGWDSWHSVHGRVRNPVAPELISGGSCGGDVAAVALGDVDLGIGTDVGGSMRVPASLQQVYGLKCSRDIIPLTPGSPYAWPLASVGLCADNVRTLARALHALTLPQPRLGWWPGVVRKSGTQGPIRIAACSREIAAALYQAPQGADGDNMTVSARPERLKGLATLWLALMAADLREVLSIHGDWPLKKSLAALYETRPELSYPAAWTLRNRVVAWYDSLFVTCDALAAYVVPPKSLNRLLVGEDRASMRDLLGYLAPTLLANVVGAPALSLPVPHEKVEGRGIQLLGPRGGDRLLLGIAAEMRAQESYGTRLSRLGECGPASNNLQ